MKQRIFVGNLPIDVTRGDLENLFSKYGFAENVEIKSKKTFHPDARDACDEQQEKFAFLEMNFGDEGKLNKCLNYFAKFPSWKGKSIKVNAAKESFMDRLQRERKEKEICKKQGSSSKAAKAAKAAKAPVRHREYHSSSSEEDQDQDQDEFKITKNRASVVQKLESFNSDFWNSTDDIGGPKQKPNHNKKRYLDQDAVPKDNKKSLFDEEEDDDDDEEELAIRPQFEGKSGQKLLHLQTKYANDERFKIDQRFHDEDQDVKDAEFMEKIENKSTFKDMSKLRFDPKKSTTDSSEKKIKLPEQTVVEVKNDTPVNIKRYYDVADNIKSAFNKSDNENKNKSANGGFSLLSVFGRKEDNEDLITEANYNSTSLKRDEKAELFTNNPFKYDSSDSEDEDESSNKKIKTETKENKDAEFGRLLNSKINSQQNKESFFFVKNDPRFLEGFEFFQKKEKYEEFRSNYEKIRPKLAQVIKNKIKNKNKRLLPSTTKRKKFNIQNKIKKRR